jgi:RHS repeat-associated protein
VTSDNRFSGGAQVGAGTSQVVVKAKDYSGNERTNTYEVSVSGSSKTFSFDDNGNMTSDGTRTFEWDAENRLIRVCTGACSPSPVSSSEFSYDGQSRRVRIVDKEGQTTTSDRWILWCEASICEARDAAMNQVRQRFFVYGFWDDGATLLYTFDHLGSSRDLVDSAQNVRARYDYDPYGNVTRIGDVESSFLFAGLFSYGDPDLLLATCRAYRPQLSRWLSEDPLGLTDGSNRYPYVHANPVGAVDPIGLMSQAPQAPGCKAACDAAYDDPDTNYGGGAVLCTSGGKKCACAFDDNRVGLKRGACPKYDELVQKHKERHFDECVCDCPSGKSCAARWKGGVNTIKSECEKRRQSVDEAAQLTGLSPSCRQKINDIIALDSQFINGPKCRGYLR